MTPFPCFEQSRITEWTDPLCTSDGRPIADVVAELIPKVYGEVKAYFGYRGDMPRSPYCTQLSYGLHKKLWEVGVPSRREFHEFKPLGRVGDGAWHFIVVHSTEGLEPRETDVITDLNPWVFGGDGAGYLHGPRLEVAQTVSRTLGVPPLYGGNLREIATVALAHDPTPVAMYSGS